MGIKASIAIATRNKAPTLAKVLKSIFSQTANFNAEVIVVDDGSTDNTYAVIEQFPCCYVKIQNQHYRNPGAARNISYKLAKGDILICQSDDVVHGDPKTVQTLVDSFDPSKEFAIATVWNQDNGRNLEQYTGNQNRRALFFLGAVSREAMYRIGGNSPDFDLPGFEDDWLWRCLENGQNLKPKYLDNVVGYHQHHQRPALGEFYARMQERYNKKFQAAQSDPNKWIGEGQWAYHPGYNHFDMIANDAL